MVSDLSRNFLANSNQCYRAEAVREIVWFFLMQRMIQHYLLFSGYKEQDHCGYMRSIELCSFVENVWFYHY